MNIVMGGAGGMIGQALSQAFQEDGADIHRLVRPSSDKGRQDRTVAWDPEQGTIDAAKLEGKDAVVHLGGESLVSGYWSEARKKRIRDSRVKSTELLGKTLAGLQNPPKTFVCASAIGFYDQHANTKLDETAPAGKGFLADVCSDWEAATRDAANAGIRVVNARIGIVLTPKGGALAKMLTPFKMGVGGRLGSGRQGMSWIALTDVVRALQFCVHHGSLSGPVNLTAPNPVDNREFTRILGNVLHRPTLFPVPGFAIRLAMGEMGRALLLSGAQILPTKLNQAGFQFQSAELESALLHELGH